MDLLCECILIQYSSESFAFCVSVKENSHLHGLVSVLYCLRRYINMDKNICEVKESEKIHLIIVCEFPKVHL